MKFCGKSCAAEKLASRWRQAARKKFKKRKKKKWEKGMKKKMTKMQ